MTPRCEEYLSDLKSNVNHPKVENILPSISGLLESRLGTVSDETVVFHQRYLFQGRVPTPAIRNCQF